LLILFVFITSNVIAFKKAVLSRGTAHAMPLQTSTQSIAYFLSFL